jgi:hypothetical protein
MLSILNGVWTTWNGYDSNQKNNFEMNFLKELSLNDKVVIHENFSEDSIIFSITKENKVALRCS